MNGTNGHLNKNMNQEAGVLDLILLPQDELEEQWNKILVSKEAKDRLISQAVLAFTLRGNVSHTSVPLHGIILLVGPPGTGKTSLARGLANAVAQAFSGQTFKFLEVEPHGLAKSSLGKSQNAVSKLLRETVVEHAEDGPLIVLLDEVEVLAGRRALMSFEANPVDVHRATDAVLAAVDYLASRYPNILFIATSNFADAIDEAFTSRADLVEVFDLPNKDACREIISDTLNEIGKKWPKVKNLLKAQGFEKVVETAVGLDGRRLRKAVISSLAMSKDTALNPNELTIDDLQKGFSQAQRAK